MVEKTPRWSIAQIDVYDEAGRLAAWVRGLHGRRVVGGEDESLDELLYAYRWQLAMLASAPSASTSVSYAMGEFGSWLILADEGGVGTELAARLQARGDSCTLAIARTVASADALSRLVEDVAGLGRPGCRGVIHLGSL